MKRHAVVLRVVGVCCAVLCSIAGPAAAAEPAGPTEQALTQEVKGGVLAGTLMLPAASVKMPVALIIAGSGPTDRDGNSTMPGFRSDTLKLLAAALARQGIASLRYDKRGIGASRAAMTSEAALRFDDYVDDAARWLATLKADPRFVKVVVIGHSEGALIGMLAAEEAGMRADGYVSLAGIADGLNVVLRKQIAATLAPAQAAESERILAALEHGQTVADVPPALAMLFRPSVQPYLISVLKYAPAERFAALRMPALIVQGTTDVQVGVDQAIKLKAAKPDALLVTVADMNHALKGATFDIEQQKAAYADPSLPLHPQLAPAIVAFMRGLDPAK